MIQDFVEDFLKSKVSVCEQIKYYQCIHCLFHQTVAVS